MKSVEHPNRKMWIKSSLRPSDRATGGPWYTDGELDEEFINRIMEFLMRGLTAHTFYASKIPSTKKPKKIVQNKRLTPEEARAARAATLGPTRVKEETTAITDERSEKRLRFASFLPMPVTYTNYPNVDDLTLALLKSGLTDVVLTAHDIQQLLDIMVYDGMIMRVILGDNIGYKAERNSLLDPDDLGSVLNEAPCGRCPVFDLCEEGGPVGPSNCEYFNEWLGL
jgi:DNA-directed RNA polymerase III subunit RPC6